MPAKELFAKTCKINTVEGAVIAEEIQERVEEWDVACSAKILLNGKEYENCSILMPKKQPLKNCNIAIRADEKNHLLIEVNGRWWETISSIDTFKTGCIK